MFDSTPKIILYIKKKSFDLYDENGERNDELSSPPSVKHTEKIVEEQFDELLNAFFAKTDIKKQPLIIVLSPEVYEEKIITPTQSDEWKKEAEKFFASLSIDTEALSKNIYKFEEKIRLIGIDKTLYELLVSYLNKLGWKVFSVVPLSIFNDIEKKAKLDPGDIKKIRTNKSALLEGTVMPTFSPSVGKNTTSGGKSMPKVILFLLVILIGGIVFWFVSSQTNLVNSIKNIIQQPTPTPSPSPIPTPTATPLPEKKKDEIKISILNGSGVTGQAGIIKSDMTTLGYKDIETGNKGSDTEKTTVYFSELISETQKKEIVTALEERFTEVELKKDPESGDIQIITGKNTVE